VLSFLKRKDSPAPAHAVDEAASVQEARTRARRRLIGAAVLVGVGIIAFPLLFETQPRPIAVDIPIVIPSRDKAPPLALPPPESRPAPAPAAPVQAEAAPSAPASAPVAVAPPRAAPAASEAARDVDAEAQRAQALLEGKPVAAASAASAPKAPRYVVQAGAYTDAAALREARQKVEKLGLKTYTQVIETGAGSRTRVRVGPFDTREEAEKAATRIKGSGLAVSILSL
jgi:DedD protein